MIDCSLNQKYISHLAVWKTCLISHVDAEDMKAAKLDAATNTPSCGVTLWTLPLWRVVEGILMLVWEPFRKCHDVSSASCQGATGNCRLYFAGDELVWIGLCGCSNRMKDFACAAMINWFKWPQRTSRGSAPLLFLSLHWWSQPSPQFSLFNLILPSLFFRSPLFLFSFSSSSSSSSLSSSAHVACCDPVESFSASLARSTSSYRKIPPLFPYLSETQCLFLLLKLGLQPTVIF